MTEVMDVSYDIAGDGDPVLLVSGIGQTGKRWRRVAAELSPHYTVVTFDNRGVGGTGVPDGPFTLADIARDALDLMSSLGFERFFLGGISMGGMISQEIILAGGASRIRAAALFATWGGDSIAVRPENPLLMLGGGDDNRPVWARLAGPGFYEQYPDIIDEETQLSVDQATTPNGFMAQAQAIQMFDPHEDAVRSTDVPIVVAHGDQDPLVPYENGVRLAKRLGVELVTYEGAGHVLECERVPEIAQLMREHFSRH